MAGDRVGDMLASKYRLEGLLGSGGMGHVYRATNVRAGRAVAIKILRSEHASNAQVVDRFLREALAANLVRHPNVVDVLDVDKDDDGAPFIVQELLAGEDLSKYVERRGKLTLREVEELLLPVIDAVAEAHAKGVVHRDIKPENVFLATQGNKRIPKLLDFGISKVSRSNVKATEVGVMMGTPAYMAPEQVQGSRDAHPRTDIWALGVMLFEVLTGRLPFDAQDAPALFVAIATKDAPRLIDVDPAMDAQVSFLVERCLRRLPEERYPSALELARDFRHVFDGDAVEPTQRRSIPAPALRDAPAFDIPDLALPTPGSKSTDPFELQPKGAVTAYGRSDIHPEQTALTDMSAPRPARASAPSFETDFEPGELELPGAPPELPLAGPPPAHVPSSQRIPISSHEPLPGVMMAGSSAVSAYRPRAMPAPFTAPANRQAAPDMSFLIALAVVGLTSIITSAILMTFAYQPEGWPVLAFLTKPTPTTSLIGNGGLGLVALGFAGYTAVGSVRRWNADLTGARGSSIFLAVIAGGLLFAALQLGRAAL